MNKDALLKYGALLFMMFYFIGVGVYAIGVGKPSYDALVEAAPIFQGFSHYILGTVSILGGVTLWEVFTRIDDLKDIRELEGRVRDLERTMEEKEDEA